MPLKKHTKFKLLLINPKNVFKRGIYNSDEYSVPPMNLGIIAALTPDHWEVEILDENLEDFEFRDADLVGLTALTSQVTRAYEIAGIYRKAKIPAVIGGIHATMMTEEAFQYTDIVVKGEAESIWGQVIPDMHLAACKLHEDAR